MKNETISDLREMVRNLQRVGFTEEAIAIAANVSQPTISRILSGKVKTAKFDVAIKIKTFHMQYCQ
jgi:predicted transcriptional regulator